MIISYKRAAVAGLFALVAVAAWADIKPTTLKVKPATDGGAGWFRATIPMPADAQDPNAEQNTWQSNQPLRIPMLLSDPVFKTVSYMVTSRTNQWPSSFSGSNTFIGMTREKGVVKLNLIYPKAKGGWGKETVNVDLASGQPLEDELGSGDAATSSTKLSPAQQLSQAQANYFAMAKREIGDDYGFFSYARLQTLRMAKLPKPTDEFSEFLGSRPFEGGDFWRDRLYDTATGARAIQESLQIDRMLRNSATSETRTVDIASVSGVETKSHPFDEMMKGREPKFSAIAKLIPADQYMLQFSSVAKFQELADFSQQWGHSILRSPEVGGPDQGLRARLQKQICLPSSLLSRMLGPALVKEMAITGSDPYFREGTDITIVFDMLSVPLFRAAVDKYWQDAKTENTGVVAKSEKIDGAQIEGLVSPDRAVSAYRVFVDNLAIYSNSLPALKRVLATKNDASKSLASAPDYKYMRVVWPQTQEAEDGFLYLSDAFIRALVGPSSKIKEQRRLEASGAMRLVTNAAMFHGYLHGPGKTPTIEEMEKDGALEAAAIAGGEGELTWNTGTGRASNNLYGSLQFLTPLSDLPISKITESEQREYLQFRDRYQQYWRRYFDPIGVRIKVDKTISLDAYILPLIDQSDYNDLKRLTGNKPAKFDLVRVSTGTLLRWQVRLDPEAREVKDVRQMAGSMFGKDTAFTDWIGDWATFWVDDGDYARRALDWFKIFDSAVQEDSELTGNRDNSLRSFFEIPVGAGVAVKNKLSLAAFLVGLQAMVNSAAPNMVRFVPQDPYKEATFVKVSPAPGGEIEREINRETYATSESAAAAAKFDPALFYGAIEDGWYISTQRAVLEGLVDRVGAKAPKPGREIEYNALVLVSPENAKKVRPAVVAGLNVVTKLAERDALHDAWLLYRCGLATANDDISSAALAWFGGELMLPTGGHVTYDSATDQAVSSVLGPMREMKKADTLSGESRLVALYNQIANMRAWVRFTEDGLISHAELERK